MWWKMEWLLVRLVVGEMGRDVVVVVPLHHADLACVGWNIGETGVMGWDLIDEGSIGVVLLVMVIVMPIGDRDLVE